MAGFIQPGPVKIGLKATLEAIRENAGVSPLPRYPKTLYHLNGSERVANNVATEVEMRNEGYKEQGE
jgi:hypothetical protein